MNSQTCISINSCTELSKTKVFPVSLNQAKYSFEPKDFPRGLHPLNPLLKGSDPPGQLTLATFPFPTIMFAAGSYDIHPEHNKMTSD